MKIVAADIGGTSSRFALVEADRDGTLHMRASTWLKTAQAASFVDLLRQLGESDFPLPLSEVDICVFAVAGPVERAVFADPPNIAWNVDLEKTAPLFGIRRFVLMNDFLAQAFASCSWIGRDAKQVLEGTRAAGGAIGVIGAGTGLGKAIILPDRSGVYVGGPSEGGHAAFAAETEEEFALHRFVAQRLGLEYIVWEMVVSGRGLSNIHEFVTGEQLMPAEVAQRFGPGSKTLELAAAVYGKACRNFALESLAVGGIFIAGGVAAKNPVLIEHPAFERSFRSSPTHAELLSRIPVFVMTNEESGLWGAAFYGFQELSGMTARVAV